MKAIMLGFVETFRDVLIKLCYLEAADCGALNSSAVDRAFSIFHKFCSYYCSIFN